MGNLPRYEVVKLYWHLGVRGLWWGGAPLVAPPHHGGLQEPSSRRWGHGHEVFDRDVDWQFNEFGDGPLDCGCGGPHRHAEDETHVYVDSVRPNPDAGYPASRQVGRHLAEHAGVQTGYALHGGHRSSDAFGGVLENSIPGRGITGHGRARRRRRHRYQCPGARRGR